MCNRREGGYVGNVPRYDVNLFTVEWGYFKMGSYLESFLKYILAGNSEVEKKKQLTSFSE